LPKRGFKSLFPNNTAIINLFHLQKFHDNKKIDLGTPVDLKLLQQKKIINKKYLKLKILGDGDLKSKINITVNFASKQAQEKIKKAGGTLNLLKKYQAQAKIKKDSENPSVLKK
jgi:large subunit ribosomal protein L15